MQLKKFAIAAVLAIGAFTANAGTTTFDNGDAGANVTLSLSTPFEWSFTSLAGVLGGSVVEFSPAMAVTSVLFDNSASGWFSTAGGRIWSLEATNVTAGAHKFQVFGTGSGTVFTAASVTTGSIAAPVPEPETYAMLLAGLGAIGFMSHRRKRIGHS